MFDETSHLTESVESLKSKFQGASIKLIAICLVQLSLLLLTLTVSIGDRQCELGIEHTGRISHLRVHCDRCAKIEHVTWKQLLALVLGIVVISSGVIAGVFRNEQFLKFYGRIMTIWAIIMAIVSIFAFLQLHSLKNAVHQIAPQNSDCLSISHTMILYLRVNAILFAINFAVDLMGAFYAMKSKQLFDYEVILDRNQALKDSFDKDCL